MATKLLTIKQREFLKMVQKLDNDKASSFSSSCPITIEAALQSGNYGKVRGATLNALADEYKKWKNL